jgi:hypothetical protein
VAIKKWTSYKKKKHGLHDASYQKIINHYNKDERQKLPISKGA